MSHPTPAAERRAHRGRRGDLSHTAAQRRARDHEAVVIDLHCHLLPTVDDGPRTVAEALTMARAQLAAGVRTVAATPHVSWDMPTDAAAIDVALADLRAALADERLPLEVVRGAELDVHQAEELDDAALGGLTLGGGRWLLLEAPLRADVELEPIARDLLRRGFGVLIAHPERSPLLQRDPAAVKRLVGAGALTQLTAASFVGRFGRTVQRYCEQLLEDGLVHVVASDAHDALRRPPGIAGELVAAGIGDLAPLLAQEIPAAILSGDAIPAVPRRPRAKSGLRALLGRR